MKKIFLFIVIAAFMSAACTKEVVSVKKPDVTTEVAFEETEYNLDMRDFAMAVNEAINSNQSFRTLIKEEVNQCFDGDYNVLLSMIVDKKVNNYKVGQDGQMMMTGGSISVKDLLNSSFENAKKEAVAQGNTSIATRGNTAGMSLVDKLIKKYPDLQVAVPFHPEHLDNDNYIPPVVFLPEEYSEDKTEILQAFRNDKKFIINAKLIPDSACIVVDRNERIGIAEAYKNPPDAPASVKGKLTEYGIMLNWTSGVLIPKELILAPSGYKIYRKENNENFKLLYQNSSFLNSSYIDMNIELNKTYYYYVVAYNETGDSKPVYCNDGEGITVVKRPSVAKSFEVTPAGLNKARIRWNFDDSENNGILKLYKREEGENYSVPFFTAKLPINGDECIDYNVTPGSRLEYKIERTNAAGTSAPKYDLMYMPYRDVTKKSSVYVKRVKCSDVKKIESWRGAPEYLIKCYRAKKVGSNFVGGEAFTVMIECNRHSNDWEYVNKLLTSNWQPGFDGAEWYDVLSFHIVEYDGHALFSKKMNESVSYLAQVILKKFSDDNDKKNKTISNKAFPWKEVVLTAIEVAVQIPNWITSEDDVIGYVHLSYFDEPNSTFTIPVACADTDFSVEFSDKR